MNMTKQKYYDALKRITSQGKKPTRSSVAFEAGTDRASIKASRSEWMDKLIEDIEKALKKYLDTQKKPETKLKEAKNECITERDELKKLLNAAYEKQLHLIKEVRKLQRENEDLRKRKPLLEDLSANTLDYTKL